MGVVRVLWCKMVVVVVMLNFGVSEGELQDLEVVCGPGAAPPRRR